MAENYRAGDSSGITRDYLDSIQIASSFIDSVVPSLKYELYGETFETPVMFAALSHLHNHHPGGMAEAAAGVKAAGAVMWAGMGEQEELEKICATGAKTIKIVKPYEDRADFYKKIEHAEKCGCIAVGIDIDHSFDQNGNWDKVFEFKMKPITLDELKAFVKATKLPFVVKGVLSVQDTQKCIDAGVQGIVVSHHHGILDYAVPPLRALPAIARRVNGLFPIFVDCCIDTGYDVYKALALGASAASVGRALMPALKEGGAEGVKKYFEKAAGQLRHVMAATCSPDLAHINRDALWMPGAHEAGVDA